MTERQFKTITKKLHFYNQGGIKNLCTMTEATLRQIMEEAAGVTQAYIRKLVQHDIDQQNKIALLSAKVYKLQKENAKVEEIKANADYQLEGRDLEIRELKETYRKQRNKRIDELQKENAELKKKKEEIEIMTNFCKACKEMHTDNLTKAKEHIRTLISCLIDWVQEGDRDYCYIADAEQFLKEIEE